MNRARPRARLTGTLVLDLTVALGMIACSSSMSPPDGAAPDGGGSPQTYYNVSSCHTTALSGTVVVSSGCLEAAVSSPLMLIQVQAWH